MERIPLKYILFFLLAFVILLSAITIRIVPFGKPMPLFYKQAQEFIATGSIQSDEMPVGYPVFLAWCIKIGGLKGIFFGQGLLYLSTVILGFIFLYILNSSKVAALLGSSILAMHPYLLINIKRIVENSLAVPLFLAFCVVGLYLNKKQVSAGGIALWGLVLGLLAVIRPNALSLLALPIIFLYKERQAKFFSKALKIAVFLVSVYLTIFLTTFMFKGRALYLPTHGAANFFGGANENTLESLIKYYNTETGYGRYLAEKNISLPADTRERQAKYFQLGLKYIAEHPLHYIWFSVFKFINLFRPDYREVMSNSTISSPLLKISVQTLLAVPFFLWLFLLILTRRLKAKDWLVLPAVILYALPFVIATSDPRYRLPVDTLMILDSIYRLRLYIRPALGGAQYQP